MAAMPNALRVLIVTGLHGTLGVIVSLLFLFAGGKGLPGAKWIFIVGGAAAWATVSYWLERPALLRRERLALGQCVRCGYDLTGNVSGVCPECGGIGRG